LQSQIPCKFDTHNPLVSTRAYRTLRELNVGVWEMVSGDVAIEAGPDQRKRPVLRAFLEAAEGTRTLDLLHGKQTL
jgi:hypothetical protein